MKLHYLLISLLILSITNLRAQRTDIKQIIEDKSQVTVRFTENDISKIREISSKISIEDYRNGKVTAMLSRLQVDAFIDMDYDYEIVSQNRSIMALDVATTVADMGNWDKYTSYEVYMQMMQDFATNYPDICLLDTIGDTQDGRKVVVLKITDNPNIDEYEPEFFYTGQMHGDEIVSGALFLRLIDYLLSEYATNNEIIEIINNTEIWINPIANPDGMWFGGNEDVSNSSRYYANGMDPNRSFKNPVTGEYGNYNQSALETVDMMNFCSSHDFVMSANSHSGAEVINYPWDSWTSNDKASADQNWWQYISHEYADIVHNNSPTMYMADFDNGVTHGGDWYIVTGSRQDFMNYYSHCREITFELSNDKLLDSYLLPEHWDYNKDAFIAYLKQVQYGLKGLITDACSGEAIKAKIEIENHDADSSFVYSSMPVGNYHRPLKGGNYDIKISANGYQDKIINNITVVDENTIILDASLFPDNGQDDPCSHTGIKNIDKFNIAIYPNPAENLLNISLYDQHLTHIKIISNSGRILFNDDFNQKNFSINIDDFPQGSYIIKITSKDYSSIKQFVKI